MEFRQIRYFLEIVHSKSFVAAASHLGLTQPALSRQMALLEREVGNRLLERSGRENQLTPAGALFYEKALQLQELWKETMESLHAPEHGLSGEYSISTGVTVASRILPSILQKIRTEHKAAIFRIYEGDARQTRQALLQGEVDLGILTGDIQETHLMRNYFFRDSIVPVVAKEHPLAKKRKLTLKDLKNEDFVLFHPNSSIRQSVEKIFRKHNTHFRPNVVMELRSIEAVSRSVESSLGVGFLSSLCVEPTMKILPIPELHGSREFYFYYRPLRRAGVDRLISILAGEAATVLER